MRPRSVLVFVLLLLTSGMPVDLGAQAVTPTTVDASGSACRPVGPDATPPTVGTTAAATPPARPPDALSGEEVIAFVERMPLDKLPAVLSRPDQAGGGTATIVFLDAMGLTTITAEFTDTAQGGPIGRVVRNGNELVFEADELSYDVGPMAFPGGWEIGPQRLALDPAQPSRHCLDMTTGAFSHDLNWILTATDATYDGQPSLALPDTGRSFVLEATSLGENRYGFRLRSFWQRVVTLESWTVDGQAIPGGEIEASLVAEHSYVLDFGE